MKKNLVSIITPMYNSEKFIKETYESIKNQTYSNWEWIVIDDNSIDNSYNLVLEFKKDDSRIKIIKNNKNLMAAKSRNKGLDLSIGEYITFIDSDDLWNKYFLEKQLRLLKKKKIDIVFSSYRRVSEDLVDNYGDYIVPDKVSYKDLLKTNYFSCLTVLYKANKFKNNRFNENLKKHEDYVMWLDLLEDGTIAYSNKEVLATYRIREKSVSRNKFKNLLYMYFIIRKIKEKSFSKTIYIMLNYIFYGIRKNIFIGVKNDKNI